MAPLRVQFLPRAEKQGAALDRTVRERVLDAIDRFALTGVGDVLPLKGRPGSFRLRAGDYRVIFELSGVDLVVTMIGHRREVYD